jgi:ABC-type Zn2+ transport system substrate-binding protein/surface adhesin
MSTEKASPEEAEEAEEEEEEEEEEETTQHNGQKKQKQEKDQHVHRKGKSKSLHILESLNYFILNIHCTLFLPYSSICS